MNNYQTPFKIDDKQHLVSIPNIDAFAFGEELILSNENTDITFNQPWYQDGYTTEKFLSKSEFEQLKIGLTASVSALLKRELDKNTETFSLENYHNYIENDNEHFKIVSKTRDLFSEDFNFNVKELIPRFEKILGIQLSDIDPMTGKNIHIIVRINRPNSNDFNPPHKDIYEDFDNQNYIPQFINFWIPIAGATNRSILPIAPRSHIIPESKILRTREGGIVNGNKYRVRMIKEWNNDYTLIRPKVEYGEVLIFTSHLIHGLAVNEEVNTTRVALEFRLFKSNNI